MHPVRTRLRMSRAICCRQALFEFGGPELNVIMAKSPDDFIERSMDELLPFGFGPSNVAGNKAVED